MLRGLPLNALRIALWLEMRQRANSWQAVLRNPVVLVGYGVALTALIALAVGVLWVRTALGTPAQPSHAANESVIQVWIITFLVVTGSVVYLLIHSAFFWHRWSVGFRTSDVDFLFATPAFDLRLMRALMFARESLWRLVAVSFSGVLIVLLFHDAATLRALGRYYLVGGYLALSYVALRFVEYTAYRYIGLWTAVMARRVRYLSWYLTAGALVWGIAVVATLIGVIITMDLPPNSPNRTEAILGHPALRLIALPSAAAADALVAPARGLTIWIGVATLMWLGVIALCSRQVWRNVQWLRDAIAVGVQYGAAQNRSHQQQSPYVLRRALEAGAKPQTITTPRLLQRWSPRGVRALLWKDLLIVWRIYHPVFVLVTLAGGILLFAGGVVVIPQVFRTSPAVAAGLMSLLLFFSVTHNDSDNQYNFNRLETQVDFLRALPFDGRTMVRSFALSGSLGAALLSLSVYLPALLLAPSQWMVLLSAFMFTNLCIVALALLGVIEGMLTADFALEAQHGLTEFGVGMVAVLSALGAGGLQIAALSGGGVGGALVLLGLSVLTLAVLHELFERAVELWERL